MKLEICAGSLESALNANRAGAHRIELCQNLECGGLTPEIPTLKQLLALVDIPVFVLIRPRAADFVYSDVEFEEMLSAIDLAKETGAHGIVSGILQAENTLDIERTNILVQRAGALEFTFHRAFDLIQDKYEALRVLRSIGVNRILSSAGQSIALDGLTELKKLQKMAGNDLIILPGGGLIPDHTKAFRTAGFREIHSSARRMTSEGPGKMHSDPLIISSYITALKA
ncbi:MAG: copper homeostasis protein CutC [Flavobacteriaceae bacterium]|nr:copper homeostasis protein CutC [Flavobacteriaceae bacterium]